MGREAYDRLLRDEQLLPFNANDIERMGRDELAHGWAEEAWLTLDWKELDGPFKHEASRQGFGTELLNQTLAYELKARTTLAFEADGLRCTISFPLPERVGRLADS